MLFARSDHPRPCQTICVSGGGSGAFPLSTPRADSVDEVRRCSRMEITYSKESEREIFGKYRIAQRALLVQAKVRIPTPELIKLLSKCLDQSKYLD
jgi:hypothetical protein